MKEWKVESEARLLTFLKERGEGSTKDVRWAIEHNRCTVNGRRERFASTRLKRGDVVAALVEPRPHFGFEKKRVVFECEEWLVYNKPAGLPSEKVGFRLVHRLDRDTTGALLLAKTKGAQKELENLFRKREVDKEYLAIVVGRPREDAGRIESEVGPIGGRQGATIWGVVKKGKWARTDWEVVGHEGEYALLRCRPLTGRTHQIRVHLRHIGHPIAGDVEYGSGITPFTRPLLHAHRITFWGKTFEAPCPKELKSVCWPRKNMRS